MAGRHGVGELLRRYRQRAGLLQQELAERSGLSVRALRNIEQQRTGAPRADSVRRLADALKLTDGERGELLAAGQVGTAGVRIAVLGPLDITVGAAEVDPGPAMNRHLIGALALYAGRVVSRDELIEVLWGDRVPRSAASLLHMYVNRVRALLEPGRPPGVPSTVVRRAQHGYRLDPAAVDIDLARFECVAGRADAGDTAAYGEALSLWRGPVLAGADERLRQHPAAIAAARRRVSVTVAAADLALANGDCRAALAWLSALVPDEPWHEGLHARLVLALSATGDPAAALRHYTALRERLVDELGVEPGPELQAAQISVLRPATPTTPYRPVVVPALLPAPVRAFTGRTGQLSILDDVLAGRDQPRPTAVVISAICGTAGIGKTALAVHWAHRIRDQFPDGQLYTNLRGFDPVGAPTGPAVAVRGFLEALGVPSPRVPDDPEAQIGLYRSLLADRRVLVVLDNARDAEQVRPLLPGSPACLVVVTSRDSLSSLVAAEGAHPLVLDVLPPADARRLLERRLGTARVQAEPAAVDAIIERCARLPLALTVMAARAAIHPTLPLATLAEELGGAGTRLGALRGGDATTDLGAVLSCSYRLLRPEAKRLLRRLSQHPGAEVGLPAVASLAGLTPDRVRPLLAELTRASLLTEPRPGRYSFHDLLRVYAAEQAERYDSPADRRRTAARMLDHYTHAAYRADLLLDPSQDDVPPPPPDPGVTVADVAGLADEPAARDWFTVEHPNLLAAIRLAERDRFDRHVFHLARGVTTFLPWTGRWSEWIAALEMSVRATDRLDDDDAQARAHRSLGRAYNRVGRTAEAREHLDRALSLFSRKGNALNQADTHLDLSVLAEALGRPRQALWHDQQALRLYRTAGHREREGQALNSVGWALGQLGQYDRGLEYCRQALTVLHEAGSAASEATTWDSVGYLEHQLGRYREAISSYHRALAVHPDGTLQFYRAEALEHLGDSHLALYEYDHARGAWRQAQEILAGLNHPHAPEVGHKLDRLTRGPGP